MDHDRPCPGCSAYQRENAELKQRIAALEKRLDERERAGKRQAAPFSKNAPKPKRPERKSGAAHGRHGHRPPSATETVDEILEAPLPEACPHCGDAIAEGPVVDEPFQIDIPMRGWREEALAVCRAGKRHYPNDLELLFHESVLLKELGDRPGAEAALVALLYAQEGKHFASANPELRTIARHNLAVLCREEGRDHEAEMHWRAAVLDGGCHLPSWIGPAELYLGRGQWADLDTALAWLDADGGAALDAAVLRARALAARGDVPAARRLLEGLIARHPAARLPPAVLERLG